MTTSMAEPTTRDPDLARRRRWSVWSLRVTTGISTVLLLEQAVFAGQFLAGTYAALLTHRENATYSGISVLVTALCGLLVWRVGKGPWWPAALSFAVFLLVALQIWVGFQRYLAIHVPLGVGIMIGWTALTVLSWRLEVDEP